MRERLVAANSKYRKEYQTLKNTHTKNIVLHKYKYIIMFKYRFFTSIMYNVLITLNTTAGRIR